MIPIIEAQRLAGRLLAHNELDDVESEALRGWLLHRRGAMISKLRADGNTSYYAAVTNGDYMREAIADDIAEALGLTMPRARSLCEWSGMADPRTIVIAWTRTDSVWDGEPYAKDMGQRARLVKITVPVAVTWILVGYDRDVNGAESYANNAGARQVESRRMQPPDTIPLTPFKDCAGPVSRAEVYVFALESIPEPARSFFMYDLYSGALVNGSYLGYVVNNEVYPGPPGRLPCLVDHGSLLRGQSDPAPAYYRAHHRSRWRQAVLHEVEPRDARGQVMSAQWIPRKASIHGRLPWSAVRDTMHRRGRVGSVPMRYVACRCPNCGQRNRVIVRDGGQPMSVREACETYNEDGGSTSWLFNCDDTEVPCWTAPGGSLGVSRSDARDKLVPCGRCGDEWCVSMHANRGGSSGTPIPMVDTAPNDDPEALSTGES